MTDIYHGAFQLSVESQLKWVWFCTATKNCLKNLVPLSRPNRSEAKINRDLLALVFPRLAPAYRYLLQVLIGSLDFLRLL